MERRQPLKKKPYAKPIVARFSLRAEEAVLGGCKTSGTTGPRGQCKNTGSCATQGS